tara:strand:- start:1101 stop:2165 length:1065 start_codon:yes stop_codon:yes gene_type:complete
MDIESLLSIKSLPECNIFNEEILSNIKSYFKESNIKYVKKNKKICNVLKNSNFNLKKNTINNKIIFILNKLSETNIDNIIIEFIKNIKIDNIENFDIFQNIIFDKIIKDSTFIDIYCDFLIKIIKYIYVKYNYKPNKLLSILDSFINNFKEENESDRLVYLNLMIIMINKNFFDSKLINEIANILIELKLIPDIKLWFEYYNLNKECLIGLDIENTRDKLMYESIFDKKIKNKSYNVNTPIKQKNNTNTFLTQCENIIEEYNYLNLNDEIVFFINNECKTNDNKSFLIEYIIKQFYNKKMKSLFTLFEYIINKNIIDKNIIKNVLLKMKNVNPKKFDLKKFIQVLEKNNINIKI